MNNIAIETHNLVKNYGTGASQTKVLRGMNIHVIAGEFVIIFGPSGSGKSTLLNMINGLDSPTSGDIVIDGVNITNFNDHEKATFHQQKIGMVFQAYNLISSLPVIKNITLPMIFSRMSKDEREKKALNLLREFDLESLANRLPSEISGGQQQRVGIMRALIGNPPIIIADEPTGNLDSIASKNVMDLFQKLNKNYHNTLIIVTHDQSLFRYADRVIHIKDGSVLKETLHHKVERITKVDKESPFEIELLATKSKEKRRMLKVLDTILSSHQLDSFDKEELNLTIALLLKRLKGNIDASELSTLLDLSREEGGAGLYRPTARNIADNFENMLELLQ